MSSIRPLPDPSQYGQGSSVSQKGSANSDDVLINPRAAPTGTTAADQLNNPPAIKAPLGKTASFFLKAALTVGGGLAGLAGIALLPLAIPSAVLGLVGGGITLLAGGARNNEGKQNIGETLVKSGLAGAFPTTGGLLVALVAYQLAYGKPKEEEL